MTVLWENITTPEVNPSHSIVKMTFLNLAVPIFILVSLLVGTVSNGFFLWVLRVKMKRTVNTLWFSHLILTYLLFCIFLPFFAIYILFGFHWVFGILMCKLTNCFISLALFTTVFLLTLISLDRYLLICHPVWSHHNRTIPRAQRLVAGVWLASLALSAPYLAFRETREEKGRITCENNYAFSNDWNSEEMQAVRHRVQLAFTVVRFLLGFLLPFCIITGCYCGIGREMKKKKLVRRTEKPFRILVAAVTSFFVFWLPYHLFRASLLFTNLPTGVLLTLKIITIVGGCFNFCFTPILYLFVGEKFQQVFKTSILTLLMRGFTDIPIILSDSTKADGEGHRTYSRTMTQCSEPTSL
ncbi:probable G-protein coupled receptor 33 [Eublepharis macularius]|uniref:Probable G-protein coupled receptor 33 n=1 Tax=Eublepharis macularius TaxID=481883 RepID=A0AA97KB46_EUBMA|nr:probable G-protein coupled receptor 33 [Eublepharis macularius]